MSKYTHSQIILRGKRRGIEGNFHIIRQKFFRIEIEQQKFKISSSKDVNMEISSFFEFFKSIDHIIISMKFCWIVINVKYSEKVDFINKYINKIYIEYARHIIREIFTLLYIYLQKMLFK